MLPAGQALLAALAEQGVSEDTLAAAQALMGEYTELRTAAEDYSKCSRVVGRNDAGDAMKALLKHSTSSTATAARSIVAWMRSRVVVTDGLTLICSVPPWRMVDGLGNGVPLLHNALIQGNLEVAKALLETPWAATGEMYPVNHRDVVGRTALSMIYKSIAYKTLVPTLQYLLDAGADPRIPDYAGATPVEWLLPHTNPGKSATGPLKAKAEVFVECMRLMQAKAMQLNAAEGKAAQEWMSAIVELQQRQEQQGRAGDESEADGNSGTDTDIPPMRSLDGGTADGSSGTPLKATSALNADSAFRVATGAEPSSPPRASTPPIVESASMEATSPAASRAAASLPAASPPDSSRRASASAGLPAASPPPFGSARPPGSPAAALNFRSPSALGPYRRAGGGTVGQQLLPRVIFSPGGGGFGSSRLPAGSPLSPAALIARRNVVGGGSFLSPQQQRLRAFAASNTASPGRPLPLFAYASSSPSSPGWSLSSMTSLGSAEEGTHAISHLTGSSSGSPADITAPDARVQAHYAVLLIDARPPWVMTSYSSAAADEAGMPQSGQLSSFGGSNGAGMNRSGSLNGISSGAYAASPSPSAGRRSTDMTLSGGYASPATSQLLSTSWGDLPRLPPRSDARPVRVLEHHPNDKGTQLKSVAMSQDPISGLLVAAAVGPFLGEGAQTAAKEVATRLRKRLLDAFRRRQCLADCDRAATDADVSIDEKTGAPRIVLPSSSVVKQRVDEKRSALGLAPFSSLPPLAGSSASDDDVRLTASQEAEVYRYLCPQRCGVAACEYSALKCLQAVVAELREEAASRVKALSAAPPAGADGGTPAPSAVNAATPASPFGTPSRRWGGGGALSSAAWRCMHALLSTAGDGALQATKWTKDWLDKPRWSAAAPQDPAPISLLSESRRDAGAGGGASAAAAAVDEVKPPAPAPVPAASASVTGRTGQIGGRSPAVLRPAPYASSAPSAAAAAGAVVPSADDSIDSITGGLQRLAIAQAGDAAAPAPGTAAMRQPDFK